MHLLFLKPRPLRRRYRLAATWYHATACLADTEMLEQNLLDNHDR